MTPEIWAAIVGSLTALFTGVAIFQRIEDRPRPKFKIFVNSVGTWTKGNATYEVVVINVGDGVALNAQLVSSPVAGIKDFNGGASFSPQLKSGESLSLLVKIPNPNAEVPEVDPDTGEYKYPEPVAVPADCAETVTVTWNHPPYRFLKRKNEKLLRSLEFAIGLV